MKPLFGCLVTVYVTHIRQYSLSIFKRFSESITGTFYFVWWSNSTVVPLLMWLAVSTDLWLYVGTFPVGVVSWQTIWLYNGIFPASMKLAGSVLYNSLVYHCMWLVEFIVELTRAIYKTLMLNHRHTSLVWGRWICIPFFISKKDTYIYIDKMSAVMEKENHYNQLVQTNVW